MASAHPSTSPVRARDVPRPEYPRPQFRRPDWLCLNGEWQFEIDAGNSGLERGLLDRDLTGRIVVPFCPESGLSGVEHLDFMNVVWYRRVVSIPESWSGRRVLLHFQAIDYDATVWVNGREVGRHRGGFSPFTCDLARAASPGEEFTLVVRARDLPGHPKPRGKQVDTYANYRCLYTRTTGIWQTVWMEPVPDVSLHRPRLTPDVAHSMIHLEQPISGNPAGLRLRVTLSDGAGAVSSGECSADLDFAPRVSLPVPEGRRHLWAPGDPHLYGIEIELLDADSAVVDRATSYAGLRSVAIDGQAVKINGRAVFQRLVLDQGYYPDGVMTAPSDDALRNDIEISMAAGFNGARLHQKVFEERFLYHADRLGYLVWGEFGDWGSAGFGPEEERHQPGPTFLTQWLEVLDRDYSHPCIVGWCPLNETWQPITDRITQLDDVTRGMFLATKAMDLTRPVLDASGYSHRVAETDVYDCHDYTQGLGEFRQRHAGLADRRPFYNGPDGGFADWDGQSEREGDRWSIGYRGQPFFVSEFGGIWWNPDARSDEDSWGYGGRPRSLEEFYRRFEGLCTSLLGDPQMFGYCYTQLTDVFQEQNGIFGFDRQGKFDLARLRRVQQQLAAIESVANQDR